MITSARVEEQGLESIITEFVTAAGEPVDLQQIIDEVQGRFGNATSVDIRDATTRLIAYGKFDWTEDRKTRLRQQTPGKHKAR